jgi:hypothetical protein
MWNLSLCCFCWRLYRNRENWTRFHTNHFSISLDISWSNPYFYLWARRVCVAGLKFNVILLVILFLRTNCVVNSTEGSKCKWSILPTSAVQATHEQDHKKKKKCSYRYGANKDGWESSSQPFFELSVSKQEYIFWYPKISIISWTAWCPCSFFVILRSCLMNSSTFCFLSSVAAVLG